MPLIAESSDLLMNSKAKNVSYKCEFVSSFYVSCATEFNPSFKKKPLKNGIFATVVYPEEQEIKGSIMGELLNLFN